MDNAPKPAASLIWLLPATLLVVVVVAGVGMFRFLKVNGPGEDAGGKPVVKKLTREQCVELLSMRDRAVGHLENHQFDEAERLLLEIIRLVPNDPFGARNLTICRELAVEKLDPTQDAKKFPPAMNKALDALDQLAVVEPNSYVTHVLAARVALRGNELDRATAALRRATEIAPNSAPVWYDLFLLRPLAPGEPPPQETVDALRKVHELEPENLFVWKDWLPLQTQLKDSGLADTIAEARNTLDPFADVIKTNTRIDVQEMLEKLATAVAAEQWSVASGASMMIRNVIVSESARDERYVRLNSLEYVLPDFGPAFYELADLPEPSDLAISVRFVSASEHTTKVPEGVRSIVSTDLDFDGELDSAALIGNQIVITFHLRSNVPDEVQRTTVEAGEGFRELLAADLDEDIDAHIKIPLKRNLLADLDLIAFGPAGIKLFENKLSTEGGRTFLERPAGDALAALRGVRVVVPGDLDLDGDLDFLTVSTTGIQLWSNKGNWSFDEITARAKLPSASLELTAAAAVDWDRDTDLDVLIACREGLGLLENLHHGRFRWRMLEGDFATARGAASLLIAQMSRDPSWSVIAAGPNGVHAIVTQTSNAGVVSPKAALRVTAAPVTTAMSLDFDNDGVRDLLTIGNSQLTLWRGLPNGKFQALSSDAAGDLKDVAAVCISDFDNDGDEDLLLGSKDQLNWRLNDGGNANGWLDVTLVAEHRKPNEQNYSKRANVLGIGSMIEVKAGDRYLAQVVQRPQTHFGLGKMKNADVMRILWTNGLPQNVLTPTPNQRIFEEQVLLGSCPYLYTWDGEKFAFSTDLLWNAPLGLKFAEDVVAPWREWEYLKVDGDKLRAKDGQYQLRVTAELWEIEYFDEIKLFAVDHPAGTQIFTNEKVGPASMAEHKIHTVSKPRLPVAARDTQGRDILDQVQARDGIFTKTFDRKLAQGLTPEHFLELDLGEWSGSNTNPKRERGSDRRSDDSNPASPVVTLFLTGWMYPGSTSLSVQHSQNPDRARQRPPSLQAVDANGQWREVRPFMGFPGGKTKTIAVDISDVFPSGSTDHRLRIVTNMEFYWDAAFFTIDDHPVEFRQAELPLVTASLKDRGGISHREWPATGNGPELFDYQQLVPGDRWPPIVGKFTRFGDVRPLLTTRDDHLVVMHPGDEIQLAFAAPLEPLPNGWVRDFVIYNVGWDKDCDQNTVYGESSEPLPFRDMTIYPHRHGEARPMDDDYVRYLKTYQTRTRSRAPFWNEIVRKP